MPRKASMITAESMLRKLLSAVDRVQDAENFGETAKNLVALYKIADKCRERYPDGVCGGTTQDKDGDSHACNLEPGHSGDHYEPGISMGHASYSWPQRKKATTEKDQ